MKTSASFGIGTSCYSWSRIILISLYCADWLFASMDREKGKRLLKNEYVHRYNEIKANSSLALNTLFTSFRIIIVKVMITDLGWTRADKRKGLDNRQA